MQNTAEWWQIAPETKTFNGLGQETGCANGKTPEKQMSDYAFREKKSERLSFCRTDLMNYWLTEWITSVIQLREVFGFGYTVGIQREEDACFLFSQVQSFKNGIAHLLRTVCADTERKGDYRFKAVNLHAALVGQSDGMPYLTLIQNAVLAECLYPCPDSRGGYIEQLAKLPLTHGGCLYIFRHNYIAELVHCYDVSFLFHYRLI